MDNSVLLKIKKIVGIEHYFDSPEDRISYSYDGTPMLQQLPEAVVFPQNIEQIS